jgi:hypothetical protein
MNRTGVVARGRLPLVVACAFALEAAAADEKSQPGAYCPLPEPGKRAACLGPAQARYQEFFAGVDRGALDDAAAAQVEADLLARPEVVAAYDALSSLAHGYYRLAKRAADSPALDAGTQQRLERWNTLLANAYERSAADPAYRDALRSAAADVHRRTPALALHCRDTDGHEQRCDSTEAVLRGMDELREHSGVRGQLTRLLTRFFGDAR